MLDLLVDSPVCDQWLSVNCFGIRVLRSEGLYQLPHSQTASQVAISVGHSDLELHPAIYEVLLTRRQCQQMLPWGARVGPVTG